MKVTWIRAAIPSSIVEERWVGMLHGERRFSIVRLPASVAPREGVWELAEWCGESIEIIMNCPTREEAESRALEIGNGDD